MFISGVSSELFVLFHMPPFSEGLGGDGLEGNLAPEL